MNEQKIREAVERLDLYRDQKTKEELDNDIQILLSLAQSYLDGKLIEPVSAEEMR